MTPRDTPSNARAVGRGGRSRERVLAAARRLFAERGFAPVTMRAIGEAAGLDNSSLYRHFPGKSALAREVLDLAFADLERAVAPAAAATPSTLEGAIDLVTAIALHLWDHPATARLLLHWVTSARDAATGFDVSLPIDAANAPSGDLYRALVDLLTRMRGTGAVRHLAWPEAFVAIMGAITLRPATYRSLLASQEPDRSEDAARAAWEEEARAMLRGMLAPPAP